MGRIRLFLNEYEDYDEDYPGLTADDFRRINKQMDQIKELSVDSEMGDAVAKALAEVFPEFKPETVTDWSGIPASKLEYFSEKIVEDMFDQAVDHRRGWAEISGTGALGEWLTSEDSATRYIIDSCGFDYEATAEFLYRCDEWGEPTPKDVGVALNHFYVDLTLYPVPNISVPD